MEADLTRGGCRKITLFIFVGFQTGYIIFGVFYFLIPKFWQENLANFTEYF
jgi:hypothetical protein